ncbi:amino acid adenylation domain-containing protein [Schlegelella sp. S2-27]|uniref:Amino acid adenylation domain-containing protein n=1 Tax=Caldimonas mangrovi TaxID=2944811 RepID=A0ABT0YRP3_9BURK|nr:amino acid adenylation domain-containing protein [Caldimonas mangrovi]
MDRGSTAYHLCGGLVLEGEVDVGALEASFHGVVRRHESLRTVFRATGDGLAEQVMRPDAQLQVARHDLSGLAGGQREARALELARELSEQPFDLEGGPLLRVALLQLQPQEHRLVVVMHHIVSDGWSMQLFVDEFAACYRALCRGEPVRLAELPIQYADYAVWQRQWLQAGERERQLGYWRGQLGQEHPVLALPSDQPRHPQGRYRGARHRVSLPQPLCEQLRRSARGEGVTVFMLLLSGLHALLHRYTGQRDIRIGVPIANRQRVETEGVIGFFVNTQVLRAQLQPRQSLGQLLEQVREAALGAQAHQDLPFEQLVEALQPERSLGHHPLFQVMFNHVRQDRRALEQLPGLQIRDWELGEQAAQFELSVDTLEQADGRIEATFHYAAELFEPATIERLAQHYLRLVQQLCERPQQAIGDVVLLDAPEQALLQQWGQGGPAPAPAQPVHRLIEQQVQRTPGAMAVVYGDEQLSYAELNRRANRLAHRLIGLGVGPEVRVGLALERSVEMVVALLAVLKAGGAYVPLDPQYPAERLQWMVHDSGVALLLTQAGLRGQLQLPPQLRVLEIDREPLHEQPRQDLQNPNPLLHGEHLAYVIYTSGSTGRPKGIAIPHHALASHTQVAIGYFGLTPDDRMLLFSTINFDGFVEQLFPPLCAGAGIVLRGPLLWDSETFHRALIEHRITIADLTTAYWFMLVQDFARRGPRDYGALRQMQATGEAMPPEGIQAWRDAGLGHVKLLNTYGPTETTVTATRFACMPCVSGVLPTPANMPIGTPLAGRRLHVLDETLQPVPRGVAGELCIGGRLLAHGYVNRAALTAERFIADPFEPGGRLYRTGDLVRWRNDGQIEYLGRIDHQVKIRGFRIELGEVEAQLLAQPGVREAVAVAQPGAGGPRLVGYVSPRPGIQLQPHQLRDALGSALPEYMVPAVVMVLDALPLNPNGKIDRKALPEPPAQDSCGDEAPQGEDELALAGLWRQLLGVERVGRNDNFFALGGHSLLAAQLSSRARQVLRRELPLRAVFENPNLRKLAECLQAPDGASADTELHPVPRLPAMPVAPIQRRLWLVDRLADPGERAAYVMATALRLTGEIDTERLGTALNAMVDRHEVLRTCYPETSEGEPVAHILGRVRIEMPVIDLSTASGDAQAARLRQVLAQHAQSSFDLAQGPLLRAALVRLSPRQHVLALAVHHIVFDGWSEAVFIREFCHIHAALAQNARPALPPLRVQYSDYAAWHSERLQEAAGRKLAEFWRDELAGAPLRSTLPPDSGAAGSAGEAHAWRSIVAPALARRIADVAGQHGATPFQLLLAAFLVLMHRQAQQDDLVIGTDVAGRGHPDLEPLIGFFVNVVPLRSRWAPQLNFTEWLQIVREHALAALDHAELPFDRIVDAAATPRDRGRSPLVQVLFVLQNVPQARFELPGLSVEQQPQPVTHAKFDLAVFVGEGSDGLGIEWVYASARHRPQTVERLAAAWTALLQQIVDTPNEALHRLVVPSFQEPSMIRQDVPKLDKLAKLQKLKKPVGATAESLVKTSALRPGADFPLVIEPAQPDLDPVAWARGHSRQIEDLLGRHAGLLFRNFGLRTPQEFEAFAEAVEPGLYGSYGDLPKKEGGRNTYRSTPYPEREMILFHNESSHLERWPRKQWFFCELPSPVGGATPIVDCREMLRRLPADLAERFERKELLYVRTFTPGLDVSWQEFFKTPHREEVEQRLAAAGIEYRWLGDDELQTRTRCPAVITHPVTGDRSFFNQVQLHHVSCLQPEVRRDLLSLVGIERMPRQVYFGDGSPIDDETMARVGRLYEECAVRFDWRQGDVVMLDNMLAAHARDPYEGPRKIVVAMGAMVERSALGRAKE